MIGLTDVSMDGMTVTAFPGIQRVKSLTEVINNEKRSA